MPQSDQTHRDRIVLQGMTFYGYHGTKPEERALGQRFRVDVELETDLRRAAASDDLADTINYSRVYRMVREIVEGPSQNLMERLAETVASQLLDSFPADAVRVRITKVHPPIKGDVLEGAGVEIYRARE